MADISLHVTATALEIGTAIADLQNRCRKNVVAPMPLAREVRSALDQAETCAAALGVSLPGPRPKGWFTTGAVADLSDQALVVVCNNEICVRRGAPPSYIKPSHGLYLDIQGVTDGK